MNFELDVKLRIDDEDFDVDSLKSAIDDHREHLKSPGSLEGAFALKVNGESLHEDLQYDPILRLAHLWLSKLPWVIGGDTETVALRDSEHCYAFVPAGESVELSFFSGTELEIEDNLFEPTNITFAEFAPKSIAAGDRLVELIKAVDDGLMESDEDCKDLQTSLVEAKKAWHDYEIHRNR